jgi:hypothetical protein
LARDSGVMPTAVQRLTTLRGELATLDPYDWSNVDKWAAAAKPLVRTLFPDHFVDFEVACKKPSYIAHGWVVHDGGFSGEPAYDGRPEAEAREEVDNRKKRAACRDALLALLTTLLDMAGTEPAGDPLDRVLAILDRFPAAVRELAHRQPSPRVAVTLDDEYDLQYVLRALLAVDFEDVRAEDPVPSRAGAPSRVDFLLKTERIVIEAKFARKDHLDKRIGEELAADVTRYRGHPDCGALVFFIYDPGGLLRRRAELERDFVATQGMAVRVVIRPK